jgi:tetratricopeptide (TPR) repeat protein
MDPVQANGVSSVRTARAALAPAVDDLFRRGLPDALARDAFTNLAVLLRYTRDGCWTFAIYNYVTVREQVVGALKQLLAPLPVYEWTYAPHDPYPLSYLSRLSEAQKAQRAVVFLFDFERAALETWKALDYNRELFAAHPHGLVFWITPPGRARIAKQAPHFWAQRSGVFDFTVAVAPTYEQTWPLVSPDMRMDNMEEIQRQLRLYQGMLSDLDRKGEAPPLFVAELHYKIARLAYYLDQLTLAHAHAEAACHLAQEQEDLTLQANVLQALGDLALREDDLAAARRHYEAALAIYPGIGDRLGEANVRKALGDLALREDDLAAARRHYEAALALYQRVGSLLGEAGTYVGLGRATDDPAYFERALGIHARIKSIYDVAVDSYYYGLLQKRRGDKQKAAALLSQASDIWRRIGLPAYAQIAQDELNGLGE